MGLESLNARRAVAVTPNNSVDLPMSAMALYIGGAGDLKIDTIGGDTITLTAVPAGSIVNIQTRRVYATGTAATSIVALA